MLATYNNNSAFANLIIFYGALYAPFIVFWYCAKKKKFRAFKILVLTYVFFIYSEIAYSMEFSDYLFNVMLLFGCCWLIYRAFFLFARIVEKIYDLFLKYICGYSDNQIRIIKEKILERERKRREELKWKKEDIPFYNKIISYKASQKKFVPARCRR